MKFFFKAASICLMIIIIITFYVLVIEFNVVNLIATLTLNSIFGFIAYKMWRI